MHVHGISAQDTQSPIKTSHTAARLEPAVRTPPLDRATPVKPGAPTGRPGLTAPPEVSMVPGPSGPTAPTAPTAPPEFPRPVPTLTGPDGESLDELSLQGLLDDWGKTDSRYDLNGDSIVNTIDLLSLLSRMNGAAQQNDEKDHSMPLLTVADLKKAWGETDSVYDLDGSGTVDMNDLLQLLAEGGTMPHPDAPITVDGLLAAWGQPNEHYDLTGDDRVDTADLLALLGRLEEGAGGASGDPQESTAIADPLTRDRLGGLKNRYLRHGAERAADRIIGRLESAGAPRPDRASLDALMSRLELRPAQRELVMQRLAERFGARSFDTVG